MTKVYRISDLPLETIWGGDLHRTALRLHRGLVTFNWFEPGTPRPEPHSHAFDQLSLVLEGSLNFEVDGEVIVMPPGSALWVPPSVPHTAWPRSGGRVFNVDVFAPAREDYLHLVSHQEQPETGWDR